MKLYYLPTTRAVRPRWCLEEMEIPYELIRVDMAMMKSPEYQKIHPHNKVPVLIDGDVTIFESAAICAYLTDKYPEKELAPLSGTPARGYYYEWLFYAMVTLEPPIEKYMFKILPNIPDKLLPHKSLAAISIPEIKDWFEKACEPLKEAIDGKKYLVDNRFTTADIITGGVLLWALKLGMLKEGNPLKTYVETLMDRPAFQRADENFYTKIDVEF